MFIQGGGVLFAYAQLFYASCLLLGYWGYFLFFSKLKVESMENRVSVLSYLLPTWYTPLSLLQTVRFCRCILAPWFTITFTRTIALCFVLYNFRGLWKQNKQLLYMCMMFTFQSFQKLVLQEGEKFVLLVFDTTYNQGVYGFVDNLGTVHLALLLKQIVSLKTSLWFSQFNDGFIYSQIDPFNA